MTKLLVRKDFMVYIVELTRKSLVSRTCSEEELIISLPNKLRRWLRVFGLQSLEYIRGIKPDVVVATNPPREATKSSMKDGMLSVAIKSPS